MKKRSYIGLALGALVAVGAVLSLPSCGFNKKLVNITIQPTAFTFGAPDPTSTEQYTAIGSYIHPPSTQDVTSRATWKVDDGIVTINAGLASPTGTICGGGTISASLPEGTGGSSNIVIGYATVTVNDPTNPLCPGGGKFATLSVGVVGSGSVTSLPAGISCPGTCIATYAVGSSVLLTATPGSGATSTTWVGCTASGNTCTATIPAGGAAVIATFK